jgi:formyltetrahydrofolate deformylase
MQILSNELSNKLFGHVINIHHSFLPTAFSISPL